MSEKAEKSGAEVLAEIAVGVFVVAPLMFGFAHLAAYSANLTGLLPALTWWQVVLLREVAAYVFGRHRDKFTEEHPTMIGSASLLLTIAALLAGAA